MSQKNIDTYRNGANSAQYAIPTLDNTATGCYTCTVTISSVSSPDSAEYTVSAIGLIFDMV